LKKPGKAYIGTSGWNYKSWRDDFYGDTPQKEWLQFCAERVTHNKKLLDVEEPVIRCRDDASPLGNRLVAVVWQLPALLKKDMQRLEKFARVLRRWKTTRHDIEFRHKSWFDDEVARCLKDHAVAVCLSDAPDWPMWTQ
jgi:uncharacterized protein YecE (DUF72 family)